MVRNFTDAAEANYDRKGSARRAVERPPPSEGSAHKERSGGARAKRSGSLRPQTPVHEAGSLMRRLLHPHLQTFGLWWSFPRIVEQILEKTASPSQDRHGPGLS